MKISIVVAMSVNNTIGNNGKIPWHISNDLKHFKEITTDHHILMGRKTYESIGRSLPNRTNIVVSRQITEDIQPAIIFQNVGDAIKFADDQGEDELMIIGGGEIYTIGLPLATKIYQTLIPIRVDGDVKFPLIDPELWKEMHREEHITNEETPYIFRNLERK